MYPTLIGVAFTVMIVIGAYVGSAIGYVHTESVSQQQRSARLYMKTAEMALQDQIALTESAILDGQAHQSIFTTGAQWQIPGEYGQGQTAYCSMSAHPTATCAWRMSWAATLKGSTSVPGAQTNETSRNINSDVDEKRLSFLLTVNEQSIGKRTTIYSTHETVTMRVYSFAPYATIVSSTSENEAYGNSWKPSKATEGDTAGCAGGTCGTDTVIHSYDKCQVDAKQSVPTSVQTNWCDSNPHTAAFDHTIANPHDTYVNSTQLSNTAWNNHSTGTSK